MGKEGGRHARQIALTEPVLRGDEWLHMELGGLTRGMRAEVAWVDSGTHGVKNWVLHR